MTHDLLNFHSKSVWRFVFLRSLPQRGMIICEKEIEKPYYIDFIGRVLYFAIWLR